jgi:uncharacterized phage protein gp47/JayE
MFRREAQVAGAYAGVGSTYSGKVLLSKINEAISIASGENDHELLSPTVNVEPPVGGIAVLGAISWQTL